MRLWRTAWRKRGGRGGPLLWLALACSLVVVVVAETLDGSRLTVVNAPIARNRLGLSNDFLIALGSNSVRIAAGANVMVTTNVTGTNVIYTIASTGGGGVASTNVQIMQATNAFIAGGDDGAGGGGGQMIAWDADQVAYLSVFTTGGGLAFGDPTVDEYFNGQVNYFLSPLLPGNDNSAYMGQDSRRWAYAWIGQTGVFSGRLSLTNNPGEGNPRLDFRDTNGTAYTTIQVTNAVRQTNVFWLSVVNPQAGDLFRFHSVTRSGGINHIVLTNLTGGVFGESFTNGFADNTAQTNLFTQPITWVSRNVSVGAAGDLTVQQPGTYYVYARASYGLTANDSLGACITTNSVDYVPSYVTGYYDKASGGALTQTNWIATSALVKLVANDVIGFRRWFGNSGGNTLRAGQISLGAFRVGDY